ncbi:PAC2 family protein [Micrococcoides hystricis]|uniref:PAC2 family protein n=1 Tax=Micrococcoides hystricis TaxID=1572761 RepID=A0ABV6P847_9MICC
MAEQQPLKSFLEYVNQVQPEGEDEQKLPTIMVAAFEGWNDAGEAATSALNGLVFAMEATLRTRIKDKDYYDYQFVRPVAMRRNGRLVHVWPQTDFYLAKFTAADGQDWQLLLATGQEPNFRWREFCADVLTVAADHNVKGLIVLGAALAEVPHTRATPATITSEDAQLRAGVGATESDYEGPTGITGILAYTASQAGLPTLSMWAQVPAYVSQPPVPKATLSLLRRLEQQLGLHFDTHEVEEDSNAWMRGVAKLMEEDEDLAAYVAELEHAADTDTVAESSGDIIAQEFERYLRRRQGGSGTDSDQS